MDRKQKLEKKNSKLFKAIFVDVGGVLLNNGWGSITREKAAHQFNLDFKELESRHRLTFDTYEIGKITLKEYLNRVVFYDKRPFTIEQFSEFMFAQSKAYPEMIELISKIKRKHGLKVVILSNECRELTEYRIKKFKLDKFVDFYTVSCFVHLRKPDEDIYRIALDISQVAAEQVIYIEDRPLFVQVADSLGIKALHHIDYESTCKKLSSLGLL